MYGNKKTDKTRYKKMTKRENLEDTPFSEMRFRDICYILANKHMFSERLITASLAYRDSITDPFTKGFLKGD
jgi:hypothetical protein